MYKKTVFFAILLFSDVFLDILYIFVNYSGNCSICAHITMTKCDQHPLTLGY